MKTKVILAIAVCAIVTLSFSFVSPKKSNTINVQTQEKSAPVGGLTMGDEL